jgi:predicted PurR-regulated permease PerM
VSQDAVSAWPKQVEEWWNKLNIWMDGLPFAIPHDEFNKYLMNTLSLAGNWASGLLLTIASNAPAFILQLTVCVLTCYVWLIRSDQTVAWLEPLFPLPRKVVREMRAAFSETTRQTLVASLAAAVIQSVLVGITFAVLGMPAAVLAAGATFVFAWIPVLGSFPAFLIGGLVLVAAGSWGKLMILLVAAGITGLADNLVRPLVLQGGGSRDLHPFVGLLAIFGGIELFGMFGVVLGPVIVALAITCLNLWPDIAKLAGWWDFESDVK